ncbi:MAG: hypothetical protein ACRD3E_19425, partial [Terriglobales bacterium]
IEAETKHGATRIYTSARDRNGWVEWFFGDLDGGRGTREEAGGKSVGLDGRDLRHDEAGDGAWCDERSQHAGRGGRMQNVQRHANRAWGGARCVRIWMEMGEGKKNSREQKQAD